MVSDDGVGMGLGNLLDGWLTVGTKLKRDTLTSPSGRRQLTGSMGIGRLAAFTVAKSVRVVTRARGGPTYDCTLDFDAILRSDSLNSYAVPIRETDQAKSIGTDIYLRNLRWWPSEDDVGRLKVRLGSLYGPEPSEEFTVLVSWGGKAEPVSAELDMPRPPLSLKGTVDDAGGVSFVLIANPNLYIGPGPLETRYRFKADEKLPELKGSSISLSWYPLGDRPSGRYWKLPEKAGPRGQFIREVAGVRVFRDHIAVRPYGEPGNDWLGLERTYVRLGPMKRFPRVSSLVGWVLISREDNPGLQDTANREGLKATAAFEQLRKLGILAAERIAEIRRVLEPVVPKEREVSAEKLGEAQRALQVLTQRLEKQPEFVAYLESLKDALAGYREQADLIALYRDRLAAGNLVNIVLHDVGVLLRPSQPLFESALKAKCDIVSHKEALEIATSMIPQVIAGYDLLRGVTKAGARRVRTFELSALVEKVSSEVETVMRERDVKIDRRSDEVKIKMREADLWAILVNLLVNSATSSEYSQGRDREFPPGRRIRLNVSLRDTDLIIECEDNGPGLPDVSPDWIWAPFNSTRIGGGSGLGLYVVSDIVSWYGGTKDAGPTKRFATGAKFVVKLEGVAQPD